MGAVYRATDTKLGREVAIKVLPPKVAEDALRMERFEREGAGARLPQSSGCGSYGIEQSPIVLHPERRSRGPANGRSRGTEVRGRGSPMVCNSSTRGPTAISW
jgi:hypothetical protein